MYKPMKSNGKTLQAKQRPFAPVKEKEIKEDTINI